MADTPTIWVNIPEGATVDSVWVRGPFKSPGLPYDISFISREDYPVYSSPVLRFSFSGSVQQLPSSFYVCEENGHKLISYPFYYDEVNSDAPDINLSKNKDGSYTWLGDHSFTAVMQEILQPITPYKLGVILKNELGETAPVITENEFVPPVSTVTPVIVQALFTKAAASPIMGYISFDNNTISFLSQLGLTFKVKYKVSSMTDYSDEITIPSANCELQGTVVYISDCGIPSEIYDTYSEGQIIIKAVSKAGKESNSVESGWAV